MNFYVVDENDPIMTAYNDIFPDLFSPKSEMSSELLDHIRYPEDLFTIQSDMYRDYHMTDPRVFYADEDPWVSHLILLQLQELLLYEENLQK